MVKAIVIGSFIAIVALVASIQIHHSVVNSDWYVEKQWRKSFEKMLVKVNDTDSIECIEVEVDDNTGERFHITEEGKVYWGELFEVECPSLVDWYNEIGR